MKITTIAIAVALLGNAASAQDVYAGVSFDYNLGDDDNSQTAASLLAGGTYDMGVFSVGAEVEYGAAAVLGGDYDTARLRLMGGYAFDNYTALASIGGTRFDDGDVAYTGYNFGLGLQAPITNALDLRGEVLRDIMSDGGSNATTTRVAAIYSF